MDERISYSEDMIFNLDYLLHVKTIAILKAPVYYYQYNKGSLVDQNLNLSSTIKMKKSVIGNYNEFFKRILGTSAYRAQLPVIYSYLLAVSRDSLALPFSPGTRKLKQGQTCPLFPAKTARLSRCAARFLKPVCLVAIWKHWVESTEWTRPE